MTLQVTHRYENIRGTNQLNHVIFMPKPTLRFLRSLQPLRGVYKIRIFVYL